jgi:hypothetical protein
LFFFGGFKLGRGSSTTFKTLRFFCFFPHLKKCLSILFWFNPFVSMVYIFVFVGCLFYFVGVGRNWFTCMSFFWKLNLFIFIPFLKRYCWKWIFLF